ncbi:hypothetical protein GQ457_03G008850 [Hibiscus cannabinus]
MGRSKEASLALFSLSIDYFDATSAKLFTIREALSIFGNFNWSNSFVLLVESDCSLCVNWLSNQQVVSLAFKILIEDYIVRSSGLKWSIEYVEKLINSTKDILVKSGISRSRPLV